MPSFKKRGNLGRPGGEESFVFKSLLGETKSGTENLKRQVEVEAGPEEQTPGETRCLEGRRSRKEWKSFGREANAAWVQRSQRQGGQRGQAEASPAGKRLRRVRSHGPEWRRRGRPDYSSFVPVENLGLTPTEDTPALGSPVSQAMQRNLGQGRAALPHHDSMALPKAFGPLSARGADAALAAAAAAAPGGRPRKSEAEAGLL